MTPGTMDPPGTVPAKSELWPRVQVLLAAFLFSTGGAAVKATTLSGWQVASFRSGVAVLGLLAGLTVRREPWPRPRPRVLLVACSYAATLTLFVVANKLTIAANAIFLQSTAPLYVLLLSPWLLGEAIRRRDLVVMAVIAVGLGLFFIGLDPASQTAPDPFRGNALGAMAGITWALTVLGLRWLGRRPAEGDGDAGHRGDDLAAVIYGNLLAFLGSLPLALPLVHASGRDVGVVVFLGLFQVALAYFFLMGGMRRVRALEASLLLLLEPVAGTFWAWLVHGEVPGSWALLGGGLIVAATLGKTWLDAREPVTGKPGVALA